MFDLDDEERLIQETARKFFQRKAGLDDGVLLAGLADLGVFQAADSSTSSSSLLFGLVAEAGGYAGTDGLWLDAMVLTYWYRQASRQVSSSMGPVPQRPQLDAGLLQPIRLDAVDVQLGNGVSRLTGDVWLTTKQANRWQGLVPTGDGATWCWVEVAATHEDAAGDELDTGMTEFRPVRRHWDKVPIEILSLMSHAAYRQRLSDWATLIAAATSGAIRQLVQDLVRYVLTRHQFGLPIGHFQAVKHRLADNLMRHEHLLHLIYAALVEPDDDRRSYLASSAKVAADDAGRMVGEAAVQLMGAMGFTADQGMRHFLARAWRNRELAGGYRWHRAQLTGALQIPASLHHPLGRKRDEVGGRHPTMSGTAQ